MIVDELRIVGSTQTNVVMAAELTRVAERGRGIRPGKPRKEGLGQLVYPFDRDLAWCAVTYLRTPTRVLWDVYRSRATRLEPLYDELVADASADVRPLFRDGDGLSIEARRVEPFAAGERQIVGTVKNALIDGAGRRGLRLHVDPDDPALRWVARLDDRDELVVSIDLGGGSLSQRGWRRDAGEAPLREHLAAVLLMLCRFDPRADVLVDPMCGSGTIPIEAILAARATPRPAPALAVLGLSRPALPLFPDAAPLVIGCDIDLGVLAAARDNARAAGVPDLVTWQRADVTTLEPALVADIARERGRAAPGSCSRTRRTASGSIRRISTSSTPRSPRPAGGSAAGAPASSSATRCSSRRSCARSVRPGSRSPWPTPTCARTSTSTSYDRPSCSAP